MSDAALPSGAPARPWSIRQLKHLSRGLRHGEEADPEGPSYEQVMVWYNDLATWVQAEVKAIKIEGYQDSGTTLTHASPLVVQSTRR